MDAVASGTIGHYSFAEKRRRIFAIMAASSGNLVEWFDFYVYSFTTIYFAPSFFPKSYTTVQQYLYAALVFAIGFLMRPIGGWMFGKIADRRGRKTSLVISVVMMCGGSLLVAILPTYQQIGFAAPLLLLLARMLQGLSVGGEYGATATYLSEVALRGERGFYSSFQYVTLIGGQLLAVLVVVCLQQFLSDAEMKEFGWRIPFVDRRGHRRHRHAAAPHAARDGVREGPPEQGGRQLRRDLARPPRGLPHGAGLHRRRLADLLHVHHVHAEVPGR